MIKIIIFVIFFLYSCSPNMSKNVFNFTDEITFEEFEKKLDDYAKNNPYPNIDD